MKKLLLFISMLVSIAAQAYEPMIREDRIWECVIVEQESFDSFTSTYVNFKFDGTENIDGRTYHKMNYWYPEKGSQPETVALMYENGESVYIRLTQEQIDITKNGDLRFAKLAVPENCDLLLYDFGEYSNAVIINFISAAVSGDCGPITPLYRIRPGITEGRTISANNKSWNVRLFAAQPSAFGKFDSEGITDTDIGAIVEGIGNVGEGLPYYLLMAPKIMHTKSVTRFLRQKDLYGNVIFDAEWLKPDYNGVDETAAPRPTDGKSYDITGKPVENPQPGTIYIQNGEKHIAR